jgi:RecA/RadA recombinase
MKLSQNLIVKPALSQPIFSLDIRGVNEVFPGFALGDFAVLQGSSVLSLTSLLCIKSQLPTQLGGLQSNVVFIDGGNTFELYQIARLAQLYHLNPKQVLSNIYLSRAFTAYQATSLIMHHLKEATKKYNAKLVIISDIAGFFLDKDIPEDEAQRIFSQVTTFLSNFAKETQTIIIATYPKHAKTPRNSFLHAVTNSKANVVLSLRRTSYSRQFVLEKHPYLPSKVAELPLEDLTLADFAEANA